MNKEAQRRKRAIELIRKTWESLDTHLDWAVEHEKKKLHPSVGNRKFHADTVRDYAKMIYDLSLDL